MATFTAVKVETGRTNPGRLYAQSKSGGIYRYRCNIDPCKAIAATKRFATGAVTSRFSTVDWTKVR